MSKKKKKSLAGEQRSYLQSTRPGLAALRTRDNQGDLVGRWQASGVVDDHSVTHALDPWSLQATANRQAGNAKARTSPRPQIFQPSGTQGMGNGTAAEYAERRSFKANSGNDHLCFGEHEARLDVSHFDASLLRSLSAQEKQDRQMGEQLVRDEELAASLQDLENRARARDEASLMLAIKLADGLVQDHDAFFRQQTESAQIAHIYQREKDLEELQLQADRELALQLQNEVSTSVSDNGLRVETELGLSNPRGRRDKRGPRRQQKRSKEALAQELMESENTGWVDNARRLSNAEHIMFVEDRNERKPRRWNQSAEDIAYARKLQQEFDQQEQWYIEAQRVQSTIAAEDRQIQDEIIAEQAEIERQEQEDCVICTEAYDKDNMLRPCQHWYCRPCLSGKISYPWRQAQHMSLKNFTDQRIEGFRNALSSKKPYQCCKENIPVDVVRRELGARFVQRYKDFELEYSTSNALYCYNSGCSAFIRPIDIHGDNGKCRNCGKLTCQHCRSKAHPGKLCSQDKETERVKELATKKGWQCCPNCKHIIEKTQGCLMMTCKCGTGFCYNCGQRSCQGKCKRK